MRPAGCPLHLLLLHHAVADHLVHRVRRRARADRLAVSVAFAKVRDELLIVADVGLEFAYTLGGSCRKLVRSSRKPAAERREALPEKGRPVPKSAGRRVG